MIEGHHGQPDSNAAAPSAPPLPVGMSADFSEVYSPPASGPHSVSSRAAALATHSSFLRSKQTNELEEDSFSLGPKHSHQQQSILRNQPVALSAQDSLREQNAAAAPHAEVQQPGTILRTNSRPVPSRGSYTVRPQALPSCCCSQSQPKVTGKDRYLPQLQDRQAPDETCQPSTAELQMLPPVQDPMGRHVVHPYHQAWRFRGIYPLLLVAALLGTGIAYLFFRHK